MWRKIFVFTLLHFTLFLAYWPNTTFFVFCHSFPTSFFLPIFPHCLSSLFSLVLEFLRHFLISDKLFFFFLTILYVSFSDQKMSQFTFLKDLAFRLVTPELTRRGQNVHLTREVRSSISRILGVKEIREEPVLEGRKMAKRLTCRTCSSKKRKTAYGCVMCNNPVCLQCSREICKRCL